MIILDLEEFLSGSKKSKSSKFASHEGYELILTNFTKKIASVINFCRHEPLGATAVLTLNTL